MNTKYHTQLLFNLTAEDVAKCSERLRRQPSIYSKVNAVQKKEMQERALTVSALTLNASLVWTAKLLARGTFSMITQRKFFEKRVDQHLTEWGETAKSCFARALCGYSIGSDSVCIDRHLERMGYWPKNAVDQWEEWFRIYERLYGAGETMCCVRWHVDLLNWISSEGSKPKPWK